MDSLTAKHNPSRFPGMSPFMAAVVGYVLGKSFTNPEIAELAVSEQENLVYIRQSGAVGFDGMESLEDLRNNWNRLIDVAGLTPGGATGSGAFVQRPSREGAGDGSLGGGREAG
jgi:hypothetical protein